MPYVCCRGCGLRFYTAAAYTTRGDCPRCGVPAPLRNRARGLDDAAFATLYDARAKPLLEFFGRRSSDAHVVIELWAETLAHSATIRQRFRGHTPDDAAAWLDAISYRQLARFRHNGCVEPTSLRRLGLQAPSDDPATALSSFLALLLRS